MSWLRAQITFNLIAWLGIIVLLAIGAFLLQTLFRLNQIFAYGVDPFQSIQCAAGSIWSSNELGNIFIIALMILGAAVLIWSAICFFRVGFSTLRFNRWVHSIRTQSLFENKTIDIIKVSEPMIFCYGLFRHRVAISEALINSTPVQDLTAMVQHELHHQSSRDPLRLFVIQWLEQTYFFIPHFRELTKLFRLNMEVEADQSIDEPRNMRQAMLRYLSGSVNSSFSKRKTVSVAYFSVTEARLDILMGRAPKISDRRLAMGLIIPTIILSIFIFFSQSSDVFAREYYKEGVQCQQKIQYLHQQVVAQNMCVAPLNTELEQ